MHWHNCGLRPPARAGFILLVASGISVTASARASMSDAPTASAQEVRERRARLQFPAGMTLAPDGRIVVADRRASQVFAIDPRSHEIEVLAGTGTPGFSGDGGPAIDARLQNPDWVAFAPDGDMIIADTRNHRLRRVDAKTGHITTISGSGENRSSGDGGPASAASLTNPYGVAVDAAGNIFVFDTEAHSIRRIDAATGRIDTAVGTGESGSGALGAGQETALARPHNGLFDARGRLVFGDSFNQRILRWDPETGRVERVAGTGVEGVSPEGTPAAEARFTYFGALVEEPDGSLVYTGLEGRIMRLRARNGRPMAGRLEHVAGTDGEGLGGDDVPAVDAFMETPYGIVRLPDGDLVFSDAGNGRIRRIDARTNRIRTIAGP